jgi:hypothetical protein
MSVRPLTEHEWGRWEERLLTRMFPDPPLPGVGTPAWLAQLESLFAPYTECRKCSGPCMQKRRTK